MFRLNKKLMYGLLLRAVAATLKTAAISKLNGARIGFISVLHTWGQTLVEHPHVHCIVPGGELSVDLTEWFSCEDSFFVHVKVLSRLFRGKFLHAFKLLADRLELSGSCADLNDPVGMRNFIDVYCKEPFSNPGTIGSVRYSV